MIYEMLIYRWEQETESSTIQIERFNAELKAYWDRHGMHLLDSWTVMPNCELYYVLFWNSLGQRQDVLKLMQVDSDLKPKNLGREDLTLTSFMSIMNINPERLFRAITDC